MLLRDKNRCIVAILSMKNGALTSKYAEGSLSYLDIHKKWSTTSVALI